MKTLEDYENRINHLHWDGLMKCKLYNNLKEKVENLLGRKFEHELFLEDERALDIQEGLITTDVNFNDDIVDYAKLMDFLKYGLN